MTHAFRLCLLLLIGLALPGCANRIEGRETRAEAEFPPEGQIVEVAGRQIHAVVRGSGPDLVLIHGAGGNARDFTFAFMDMLTDRYRVIVFDRPGFGFSERATDGLNEVSNATGESPAVQAKLLQAAAAKLGAERPLVLGHSFGGSVAMAWALERPDNVAALVVLAGATMPYDGNLPPYYPLNASRLGAETIVPALTALTPQFGADLAIARVFRPQDAPDGYGDFVGVGLSLRRASLRANAQQVNVLNRYLLEMEPRYPDLTLPVEILHGTADRIVPTDIQSDLLATRLANARLSHLQGVGHMPHHVVPLRVIAAIDRAAARAGLR